jgi:hypothetical protein
MADMDTEIDVPLLLDQVEDNRSEQTLESPTEDELGVESLDYDPIHSFVSSQQRRAQQRRHFYGYKTNTFLFQLHPNTHTIIYLFADILRNLCFANRETLKTLSCQLKAMI